MTSNISPDQQVIFLLGELKGSVDGLRETVAAQNQAQADINANHSARLDAAHALASEAKEIAVAAKQSIPTKSPWWQIASGWSGIAALVVASVAIVKLLIF